MKTKRLLAFLMIICVLFSVCACKSESDEESAAVIEQEAEQDVPEKEDATPGKEDAPPGSTDVDNTEQKPIENDNNNVQDEPSKEEKPTDDKEEDTMPDSSQNNSSNTGNSISYDPSKYYVSSKSDIVFGNDAELFVRNNNGSYTAVFNGKDASYMKKYLTELSKKGFKKYTESSFEGSGSATKNTFATYTSDAYAVDIGHHAQPKRMYVTYTPIEANTAMPQAEKPSYTPCGMPTIITQVGAERFHPTAVSMCYVIRAADGSFIVYDSDFGEGMAELIYDVLKKQAPDPNNIVIAAWVVTHPHADHVGAFIDFADKYAGDKTITLKQMVYNYSNDELVGSTVQEFMRKTPVAATKLNPNVTFLTPHAGNVLYYADLTFRVLYTQEEYLAPTKGKIEDSNGASVVMQMETESGVKVLFGADHPVNGSYQGISFCEGALYNWYGTFIKSDIVTLFHHGFGGGADLEIYKYIKPKVVLWPATFYRLTHDSDGTPYSNIEFNERNLYFSDPNQAKKNGVLGYYISGDKIHIVDLSNKNLNVTEYEHCDKYLK